MIAIKGMETPKRCAKCKFCINQKTNDYGSFGECLLQENKKVNCLVWSRDDNCPLVEVVTCKDCKHNRNGICPNYRHFVDDNFFCADGERRE